MRATASDQPSPGRSSPLSSCSRLCRRSESRRDRAVEDEQHDRDRDRQDGKRSAARRCRSSPGTEGTRKSSTAHEHEPELEEHREAVERLSVAALAAEDQRDSEHEQDVRDDAAGERAAHHVRERRVDGEQGDDQLRRVAEARVQEAPDSRARCARRRARSPRRSSTRAARARLPRRRTGRCRLHGRRTAGES